MIKRTIQRFTPMELFVLAVIVGISGGLAARLTPRKG